MTVLFDAILTPHRSLSQRGFRRLMIFLGVLLAIPGLYFLSRGAWPITGFCGLEFVIIYWLFKRNYADARSHERVTLTKNKLQVEKHLARGNRVKRHQFGPGWTRVEMDPLEQPGAQLHITESGQRVELGSFLSAPEKADFADALGNALKRWPER
ncbi:MAG: DUF2244 domain-containing protein [Alphaproteobacteria bacterium]